MSRARSARGFTLVEMLATIMIIALLAALATPSFIAMIRDRRVVRAGLYLADSYREARTRALSRGNSTLVRWRSDGAGKGTVEMYETIVSTTSAAVPKTCNTADFSLGSTDARVITTFDFAGTTYELANMKLYTDANAETTIADVCFSPDGRALVRYTDSGGMVPLTGVLHYDVINTRTNFKRVVFVPPNGVARLQL
jgi:type IV fimbrial biogenesis protein FimT